MPYVIRSIKGMIFETSQIGKSGEETYQTKIDAELAMKDVKKLYKEEEFYITIKDKECKKENR